MVRLAALAGCWLSACQMGSARARRRCAQTTALTTLTLRPCRSKHKECSLGREALQQPSRHGRGFRQTIVPGAALCSLFPFFGAVTSPLFLYSFSLSPLSPAHALIRDHAKTRTRHKPAPYSTSHMFSCTCGHTHMCDRGAGGFSHFSPHRASRPLCPAPAAKIHIDIPSLYSL